VPGVRLPQVTVDFDNGAGSTPFVASATKPGNPYPGYTHTFSTFPVPGTTARSWYLASSGQLLNQPTKVLRVEKYTDNPKAGPAVDYLGSGGTGTGTGGLWGNASQWTWDWKQRAAGTAVSYLTAPMTTNTTVFGAGAVYAWVKSSSSNVDLMATISEVSPDGKETYVQSGYLRADERKLATGRGNVLKQQSTLLEPVISMRSADVRPMPANKFVRLAYRTGSRLRVTISAVNGDQPIWAFAFAQPAAPALVSIAHSPSMPSRLVLPVVPGLSVPTARPACGILRNEPCRPYVRLVNRVGAF
jgi:predicted acyl esterase